MFSDLNKQRPSCYGLLDKVFPFSRENGLREVYRLCLNCSLRVECLREAIVRHDQCNIIKEECVKRDVTEGGIVGFIRRWSRLKRNL